MEKLYEYIPFGRALAWIQDRQQPLLTAIGATAGTLFTVRLLRGWWNRSHLTCKRKDKQKDQRMALDALAQHLKHSKISDEEKEEICELSLEHLTRKLQDGELKAVEVLHAYQKKALEVNEKTNAIIDTIREAEAMALECDQIQNRSGRLLHGVPVSIKDNFIQAGYDSVLGMSCNINKPYDEDCVLVKVLKHQGAVPFVRTNVPQTMISLDTCNPIFGQTYNPHGTGRSVGGSSGGEGALIGGGGSPLGLAGDIGGSIRMPSSMCGICGFKPTAGRLSTKGMNPKGQTIMPPSYGPMARDVHSLVLMTRALLCQYHFNLDKKVPPLPFSEEAFNQTTKIRIGYYLEDGYMISTPPMQRAVQKAVSVLQNQGYEVVPWKFPDLGRLGMYYGIRILCGDGYKEVLRLIKDDATDHAFGMLKRILTMNRALLNVFILLMKLLYPRIGLILPSAKGVESVSEWQKLVKDVQKFKNEVEDDLKEKGIDALITPAFTMPAPPVGAHRFFTGALSYTILFNVLNFPAGTLPVTKVTAEDTAKMANYPTPDPWHRTVKKCLVGAEGLPVGVQVAGLPWEDETCLRIMKDLETGLKQLSES